MDWRSLTKAPNLSPLLAAPIPTARCRTTLRERSTRWGKARMGEQGLANALTFLSGGGKMGALMRAFDWTKTPLGDPTNWPDPLKMAIATCLASRFPMVVWWGPELLMLYNDAWQPILGETKHPAGLGRPGKESWPE